MSVAMNSNFICSVNQKSKIKSKWAQGTVKYLILNSLIILGFRWPFLRPVIQ